MRYTQRQLVHHQGRGTLMEQLISAKEAAARVGVSVATIKAWMRRAENPLPSIQVGTSGSHRRIVAGQIDPWLTAEASRTAAIK